MRYIIMVRETLSKEIPVYANSITEAVALAADIITKLYMPLFETWRASGT